MCSVHAACRVGVNADGVWPAPPEKPGPMEVLHATFDEQIVKWGDCPVAVGGSGAAGVGTSWTGVYGQRSTGECADHR